MTYTYKKAFSLLVNVLLIVSMLFAYPLSLSYVVPVSYAESNDDVVLSIDIDFPTEPQKWAIITSKGYYYLLDPPTYTITLYYPGVSSVRVSYDFDNYNARYACEKTGSSTTSATFECQLPYIGGIIKQSLLEDKVLMFSVKVDYSLDTAKKSITRTEYFDFELLLEDAPQQKELEAEIVEDGFVESTPYAVVSAYISEDGSAYCKGADLSSEAVLRANISTNYLNPNDWYLTLKGMGVDFTGGGMLEGFVSSQCEALNVYKEEGKIEFECVISDVEFKNDYVLCSDGGVDKNAVLDAEIFFSFELETSGWNYEGDFYYDSSALVESTYDSADMEVDLYLVSTEHIECSAVEGSNYCTAIDEEQRFLKKVVFGIDVVGVDPSYYIKSAEFSFNVGGSSFGDNDFDFGECNFKDRKGLTVSYECSYYLPLISSSKESVDVSYDISLVYENVKGEESSVFVSGERSFNINIGNTDTKLFYFTEKSSLREGSGEIKLPLDEEGNIPCILDPREMKCYVGEDIIMKGRDKEGNEITHSFSAPLYIRISGILYSNFLDAILPDSELFNLSYVIDNYEGTYTTSIFKKECSFTPYTSFRGLYYIECKKDLSDEEPFINGISFDLENPPKLSIWVEYSLGEQKGEIATLMEESVFSISEEQKEILSTISFKIYDVFVVDRYITNVLADKVLDPDPQREPLPICRVPIKVSKALAEGYGDCKDEYERFKNAEEVKERSIASTELWACIFSNTDREYISPEDLGCKFGKGMGFISKISDIYNKSDIDFIKLYYRFASNPQLRIQEISIGRCLQVSVDSEFPVLCENYSASEGGYSCFLGDTGEEDSYYLGCLFNEPLSMSLNPAEIPNAIYQDKEPLEIVVSVEDNGFYRNGSDVYYLDFIIENSYYYLNNRLNSLKEEKRELQTYIDNINDILKRLLIVLGVISVLDLSFGENTVGVIPQLSVIPSPRLCLVGCLGCLTFSNPGAYSSCVSSAYSTKAPGCGACSSLFDVAFKCGVAGTILLSDGISKDIEKYEDAYMETITEINKVQELLNAGDVRQFEETVERLKGKFSVDMSVQDSVRRSWSTQFYKKHLSGWKGTLLGVVYGGACANSIASSIVLGGSFSSSMSVAAAVAKGAGIGLLTGTTMQYIYTGSFNPLSLDSIKSGVMGGIGSYVGMIASSIIPYYSAVSLAIGLGQALEGGDWKSVLGNFFLATGISYAWSGAMELISTGIDKIKALYEEMKEINDVKETLNLVGNENVIVHDNGDISVLTDEGEIYITSEQFSSLKSFNGEIDNIFYDYNIGMIGVDNKGTTYYLDSQGYKYIALSGDNSISTIDLPEDLINEYNEIMDDLSYNIEEDIILFNLDDPQKSKIILKENDGSIVEIYLDDGKVEYNYYNNVKTDGVEGNFDNMHINNDVMLDENKNTLTTFDKKSYIKNLFKLDSEDQIVFYDDGSATITLNDGVEIYLSKDVIDEIGSSLGNKISEVSYHMKFDRLLLLTHDGDVYFANERGIYVSLDENELEGYGFPQDIIDAYRAQNIDAYEEYYLYNIMNPEESEIAFIMEEGGTTHYCCF